MTPVCCRPTCGSSTPGLKYDEPAIGRVITSPETRGSGLGRRLMAEGIQRCDATWPGRGIRISAQSHLARFYSEFGFVPVGEPYLEDNIPHLEMARSPS
jgi:ElaA protein